MTNEEQDRCETTLRNVARQVSSLRVILRKMSPGQGADVRAAIEALNTAEIEVRNAYRRIVGEGLPEKT